LRLKILKKLKTVSLNFEFTGSYEKVQYVPDRLGYLIYFRQRKGYSYSIV